MKQPPTYQYLLDKAENYCASSEHCAQDVVEKLYAWGCRDKTWQTQIVDHLVELSFINDERYCRAFVHDKLRFQGWGRQKISMMLHLKHLSEHAIEAALSDIDEDEYRQVALRVARSRLAGLVSDESTSLKMMRYMLQRGFEYEMSKSVIETSLSD